MTQGVTLPAGNWVIGAANPSAMMMGGGDFGDGFVYLSTDGINWASIANIGYPGAADACGWGTSFCIVGQGGLTWAAATYTGDNWDTWADGDLDTETIWEGVAAKPDGSLLVAVGTKANEGVVSRSSDGGATWTAPGNVFGTGIFPSKVTWNGTVWMAGTYSGAIWTSGDGVNWTERMSTATSQVYDIIARLTDGLAVAVGADDVGATGIWYTNDNGDTWTLADEPVGFTSQIVRVAANSEVFVVTEDGGSEYAVSPDGSAWSAPVPFPDNPGFASVNDDAEWSRDDMCMRAAKFADYGLLVTPEQIAAGNSPFFHFNLGA